MRLSNLVFPPLAGLAGIAAALWLAPFWRGFDAFRQLWPLWALLTLVTLAAILLMRHRTARWPTVVIALLIWLPGLGEPVRRLTADRVMPSDTALTLRVATHNMWVKNTAPAPTAETLLAIDADILALQEAFANAQPARDRLERTYPFVARCRSTRILSRLEVLESGCVHPPDPAVFRSTIPCDWEVPPATWARIRLPDGSETVVTSVHLTWPFPDATQDCQRGGLARFLERLPQERMIVMGDFNAAAPSYALLRLERDLGLRRRTLALPSFPSGARPVLGLNSILGIDHIFAGEAWQTVSVETGPQTGSDHRPVVATLQLH